MFDENKFEILQFLEQQKQLQLQQKLFYPSSTTPTSTIHSTKTGITFNHILVPRAIKFQLSISRCKFIGKIKRGIKLFIYTFKGVYFD